MPRRVIEKDRIQLIVVITVALAWLISVIVAIFDGVTVLRITTPLLTMICGVIFTAKATEA